MTLASVPTLLTINIDRARLCREVVWINAKAVLAEMTDLVALRYRLTVMGHSPRNLVGSAPFWGIFSRELKFHSAIIGLFGLFCILISPNPLNAVFLEIRVVKRHGTVLICPPELPENQIIVISIHAVSVQTTI